MSLPYVDGIIEATIDNNILFLEDEGTGQGEVALSDLKFVKGNTRRFQYDADVIDLSFTNSSNGVGNINFNISDGTDVSYIDVSFGTSGTYYLRDGNNNGATNDFTITVYQDLHELQNDWLSETDNTSYNKFHTTCIKGRMDLSRGDLNIRGNLLALDNNSEEFIYYERLHTDGITTGWDPVLKNNSTLGVYTDTDVSMSRTRAIFEPKPAYSYGFSKLGDTYEPYPGVNYQQATHHVYGLNDAEHMIMSYDESTTFLNPVVWKYSTGSWTKDAELDVFSSDISDCDVTLQNCTMSYDSNFVAATYRALNGSSLTDGYYMDVFGKHSSDSDTDKYTKMRIYIGGYTAGWDQFYTLGQQAISGNIYSNGSTDYRRILYRHVSENRELRTQLIYKDISFNANDSSGNRFGSTDVSGTEYPFNRYGASLNGMYDSGGNARLSIRDGTYAYISDDGLTILTRTLMRSANQTDIGSDYSFYKVNDIDSNNNLDLNEQLSFTNDEAGEWGYRYQRESQLSPDGDYAIIGVDVYEKQTGDTWVDSKKDNLIPGTNVVLDTAGVAAPHVDNSTTVITNNGFRVFVYNEPDSKIYIYQKSSAVDADLAYSLHDTIDYSGTMNSNSSKGLDLVTGEVFTQHDHSAGLHQTGTVSVYQLSSSSKTNPTFDMHLYTHDELRIKIHDSNDNPQTEFRFDYDGFYAPVKNFEIKHPLRKNYKLRHTSVETPQVATMYSGNCQLVDGRIEINIDNKFNMTNGTFSALNVEPFVFTSNESEYDEVKGYVEDGVLIIECENTSSNASVSWIIFGKRNDDTIQNSKLTDGSGNYITEIPLLSF